MVKYTMGYEERLRAQLIKATPRHPFLAAEILFHLVLNDNCPTERTVNLQNDLPMIVRLPDITSLGILVGVPYEQDVPPFMRRLLKNGDVFYDVGAHFGYHSLMASSMVGEDGGEGIPTLLSRASKSLEGKNLPI